jgi:lipoate-protein ligase A
MRVLRGRADSPDADRAATDSMVERTRQTGTPALPVWQPHRKVAFGRRDVRPDGYDRAREAAENAGFPAIERSVGGRAVAYTGSTVAVALARPSEDVRSGIAERYDDALHAIQRALWRLGVPAQQHEPEHAFCPGGHSLSWDGKIVGVAQRVRADVAMVGAIVVVDDHEAIAEVLDPVYAALSTPFDPDTVGSIARADGRADPQAVVEEIEGVFVEVDESSPDVGFVTD